MKQLKLLLPITVALSTLSMPRIGQGQTTKADPFEGRLVKDDAGRIYLIERGLKRPMPVEVYVEVLHAPDSSTILVTDGSLKNYPTSETYIPPYTLIIGHGCGCIVLPGKEPGRAYKAFVPLFALEVLAKKLGKTSLPFVKLPDDTFDSLEATTPFLPDGCVLRNKTTKVLYVMQGGVRYVLPKELRPFVECRPEQEVEFSEDELATIEAANVPFPPLSTRDARAAAR